MAESVQRSKGRPSNYKMDRGGVPAEFGPFAGIVMSTVDPTRSGRFDATARHGQQWKFWILSRKSKRLWHVVYPA